MELRWGALIAVLILLPAMLYALPIGNGQARRSDLLNGAAQEAQCRADFVSGYVKAIEAAFPNATGLGPYADKVESDAGRLKELASGGDADRYRSFLRGSFDADITSVHDEINGSRPWKGADNATLASLKAQYQSLLDTYKSCSLSALRSYAFARVETYQDYINAYSNQSSQLSARGIGTSGISTVLSGASSQIVQPLQSAIQSANNASQIRDAFWQHCLFDGCKNGTNYHLEAKYQVARLGAMIDYYQGRVGGNATLSNVQADLAQAQTDLAAVQSRLTSVGTAAYSEDDRGALTSGIRNVSRDIQQALADLRQAMRSAMNRTRGNGTRGGFNGSRGFGNGTRPFGNREGNGARGPANASPDGGENSS